MVPNTLEGLRQLAHACGPIRLAIAGGASATATEASRAAKTAGIATPIPIVGDSSEEVCRRAAEMAAQNKCDVILKGNVRTDELLRAILDRKYGLRSGRLLSDVLIYEDIVSGTRRLVGVTDGGVNVAPDAAALKSIIENAVEVFHAIGFTRPRVAILSATEVPTDSVPSSLLARELVTSLAHLEADFAGPLALDNALLPAAARAKGITGPVAGQADILVTPTIEAGNILGKSVKYHGGSSCAHVIVGARVPVLIPSRAESAQDKLNSIALGAIIHARSRARVHA